VSEIRHLPDVGAYLRRRKSYSHGEQTSRAGPPEELIMNNTFDTYQAEIEYRSNKIRKDIAGHSRRHFRVPFVRRPSEATRTDR
jgi:hypothetical protein